MKKNMIKVAALVVGAALTVPAMAFTYSQNFESLNAASPTALGGDGWKIFANVFGPGGNYLYGYGVFDAPNGTPGFSSIASGEAGAAQGTQYLNIYSDYNNSGAHSNGERVEALVFQERTLGASDLGMTYVFNFDYKASSNAGPGGATTTAAFIKILDPSNGFATLANPTLNTTNAPTASWVQGSSLSLTIDNSWSGKLIQFGFVSNATNFQPSGVFYDNISMAAVPEPATMTALALGLAAVLKRRRA